MALEGSLALPRQDDLMSSSEEPVVTITGLDLTKDKNALEKLQQEKIWFCSATERPRLPPRLRSLSDDACTAQGIS